MHFNRFFVMKIAFLLFGWYNYGIQTAGVLMDKIKVTAHMASPLVVGLGYMTLDALLAALLFDQTQDVDLAHSSIPVVCTDGLFHASGAIIEGIKGRVAFIASLRPGHSIDPDLILKNKKGELHRKIDTSLTNVLNSYSTVDTQSIAWIAEGDADKIEALLSSVAFIGKRRASGFGEVRRWSFDKEDLDGVYGGFGEPLRPIPDHLFKGDANMATIVDTAWRPAYWDPLNRARCFAPPIF